MKVKKFERFIEYSVIVLSSLFLGILTLLSLKYTAASKNPEKYGQELMIIERNIYSVFILILSIAFLVILSVLFLKLSKEKQKIVLRIAIGLLLVIHLVGAIIWVNNGTFDLYADPSYVWYSASQCFDKNEGFHTLSDTLYFELWPFQSRMIFVMYCFIKLFGTVNPISWGYLNIVGLLVMDISLVLLSGELVKENKELVMTLTAIIDLLFAPVVFYTTFVYGTLLSLSFITLSFYLIVKFVKTGLYRYGIPAAFTIPVACLLYTATYIAVIAISIILVGTFIFKARRKRYLLLIVATCVLIYAGNKISYEWFFDHLDIERVSGVSASSYVYMGLTSVQGVNYFGSYDGSNRAIWMKYGPDSDWASEQVRVIVGEYLSGERDYHFLVEKTKGEWLEPTFGGIYESCYTSVTDKVDNFLQSDFMKLVNIMLKQLMSFIYASSVLCGLLLIIKSRKNDDTLDFYMLLPFIYVIGGILFYFAWEAKPRYLLSYYVQLFPLAAAGISYLACCVPKLGKKHE